MTVGANSSLEDADQPDSAAALAALSGGSGGNGNGNGPATEGPGDWAVGLIKEENDSHAAKKEQYSTIRRCHDDVEQADSLARERRAEADDATTRYGVAVHENPDRHAHLPRQLLIAMGFVVLDGIACYFAAEAVGGGQAETALWTALFLGFLMGAEWGLDAAQRAGAKRVWRYILAGMGAFVAGLGMLRGYYLATVGSGLLPAVLGAALLSAATSVFLLAGYRALRVAETSPTWRLRRSVKRAKRKWRSAQEELDARTERREQLVRAYMAGIRPRLLEWVAVKVPAQGHTQAVVDLEKGVLCHLRGDSGQ